MNKHAPGPWRTTKFGLLWRVEAPNLEGDAAPGETFVLLDYLSQANAERIVACVNACEGIADPSMVPELIREVVRVVLRASAYGAGPTGLSKALDKMGVDWKAITFTEGRRK